MSLHHSNIVQVLDLGVSGGRYFLVLELVDGWDLEQDPAARARRRRWSGRRRWRSTSSPRSAARSPTRTARAHDGKPLGIVHRDISPNNVLISEQGEVKLADFGIAKAQRKREQTAAGVIKGKVAFMSPEQATGDGDRRRSDLFSVGSMLYLMVTDKLPFEAATDLEAIFRVQSADFTPPEEAQARRRPRGRRASSCARCGWRRAERYQTADEMLVDVERVLRTEFQSAGQTELKLWLAQLGAARRRAVASASGASTRAAIVKDEHRHRAVGGHVASSSTSRGHHDGHRPSTRCRRQPAAGHADAAASRGRARSPAARSEPAPRRPRATRRAGRAESRGAARVLARRDLRARRRWSARATLIWAEQRAWRRAPSGPRRQRQGAERARRRRTGAAAAAPRRASRRRRRAAPAQARRARRGARAMPAPRSQRRARRPTPEATPPAPAPARRAADARRRRSPSHRRRRKAATAPAAAKPRTRRRARRGGAAAQRRCPTPRTR